MVQKKHKKRRHNKRKGAAAQAAPVQEQGAVGEEEPKQLTRAEKKEAKAKAKAEEARREKKLVAKGKDGKNPKKVKPGLVTRVKEWFMAVRSEMKRVVWPTRNELINASLIVVGALVFFGVYIAIIDNVIVIPLDAIASLGN